MDTEIKEYVYNRLNKKSGAIILEIGAHYGEDTVDMINVFKNPVIYCFEPDPRNLIIIRKYMNMIDDKVILKDAKVYLYETALFNKNGEQDFYLSYRETDNKIPDKYKWIDAEDYKNLKINNSGSSSLKYGSPHVKNSESVTVKTMRLDDWAKSYNVYSSDFIWLDVQGSEKEVIDGGVKFLHCTKFIWMEYGEMEYNGAMNEKQTIKVLNNIDFSFVLKRDNNMLFKRNDL